MKKENMFPKAVQKNIFCALLKSPTNNPRHAWDNFGGGMGFPKLIADNFMLWPYGETQPLPIFEHLLPVIQSTWFLDL